jgi:putative ABC transport system substrate-binding protein
MRRRNFIALLGGAAATTLAPSARAQSTGRMRRVGILFAYPANDTVYQGRVRAFREELGKLGWKAGVNIEFDERWTTDNMDLVRNNVASLIESKPDAILTRGGRVLPLFRKLTRTIPIVVPGMSDPVATGFVESLARPNGNMTGFTFLQLGVFGKILELLKQIAPSTRRVALVFNADNPNTTIYRSLFEESAGKLSVEPIISPVRGLPDIERVLEDLAKQADSAVMFPTDLTLFTLRGKIASLVARSRLPAIYPERDYVESGGLASYGGDLGAFFRQAAGYVDRILRGERAGDLPVQQATAYQLALNQNAAKAIGLEFPPTILALADEVIE